MRQGGFDRNFLTESATLLNGFIIFDKNSYIGFHLILYTLHNVVLSFLSETFLLNFFKLILKLCSL